MALQTRFAAALSLLTMAAADTFIIDDRSGGDYAATSGGEWRLITDGVMGGISHGRLSVDVVDGRRCLRLRGDVRLDNNGGFVQAALDLARDGLQNIRDFGGLTLTVYGNGEHYNVHLRTLDNPLPWQSYRASFNADRAWKTRRIPFSEFLPYRTDKALDVDRLRSIGIVAIGRAFKADLCIGMLGLYR